MVAGSTLHLDVVAAVAVAGTVGLLAILLVLLGATLDGGSGGILGAGLGGLLLRSYPARNLPCDTCKALELKASLGPSATRLARTIESAKASVDSTLVCLRSQLVAASRLGAGVIDRTVLPRK